MSFLIRVPFLQSLYIYSHFVRLEYSPVSGLSRLYHVQVIPDLPVVPMDELPQTGRRVHHAKPRETVVHHILYHPSALVWHNEKRGGGGGNANQIGRDIQPVIAVCSEV